MSGLSGATAISAGTAFACAVVGATGEVMCWGDNRRGHLGQGATWTTPKAGLYTVQGITNAAAVAAGSLFACATRSTGAVACWGNWNDALASPSECQCAILFCFWPRRHARPENSYAPPPPGPVLKV